jgi:GNAT superfamily N-acetyltransferase
MSTAAKIRDRARPASERQQAQLEVGQIIFLGKPGSELVRDSYLIQHLRHADGSVTALATLAWVPRILRPLVLHPAGFALPRPQADGVYSEFGADTEWVDAQGYGAFHAHIFGTPADDTAEACAAMTSVVRVIDGRIVAWVSGRLTDSALLIALTTAAGFNAKDCVFLPPLRSKIPSVEIAWVAENYRGRGIAAELVRALTARWGLTPDRVAYTLPFTSAGFQLARSVAGPRFVAVTQGIITMLVAANEAGTLAPPDGLIDVPEPTPEIAERIELLQSKTSTLFDLGRVYSNPTVTTPRPKRRRDVRAQKAPRGKAKMSS